MPHVDSAAPRAGGRRTVAFFSGLLGLNEQTDYRVKGVRLNEGRFTVEILGPDGDRLEAFVEEADAGKPFFLKTDALALCYVGSAIPASLAMHLRARAFAKRRDATVRDLHDVLDNDPDSRDDVPRFEVVVPAVDTPAPADVRAELPARPGGKLDVREALGPGYLEGADFFGGEMILCYKVLAMWSFNPCTVILHGDSECFGPPNLGLDLAMTVSAPWDNHVRDIGRPASAPHRHAEPDPRALLLHVTDLRDTDVIHGARRREEAIFEHVFSRGPGPVVFFHACVGVVMGSHIEDTYRAYKRRHHLPVLCFRGGENRALRDLYRELLIDLRLKTPPDPAAPGHRVNFIGYTGLLTRDLTDALARLGVETNGVILPALDADAIGRFERGGVNVMLANDLFQSFYDQLLVDTKVPRTVRPLGPYGVEGTQHWIEAIARETGLAGNLEATVEALLADQRERWQVAVSLARRYTLGFVVRDGAIRQLTDPACSYGIPVLATVAEMGFAIDVLVEAADAGTVRAAEAEVQNVVGRDARVTFRSFDSFESMMELLRASPARAVLSNYFFDWRVTGSGKAAFSLQHFEPGIEGACRTAERLVRLCEATYYSKYARFLPRDRAAVRTKASR